MEEESVALKPSIDACLSVTSELPSTVTPEEEPFLNFDPNAQLSFEDMSRIFNSLVVLVKAGYPFDNALEDRAAQFLESLEPEWDEQDLADKLVEELVLFFSRITFWLCGEYCHSSVISPLDCGCRSVVVPRQNNVQLHQQKFDVEWKDEGQEGPIWETDNARSVFEGFEDTLEQKLLNDTDEYDGLRVVDDCLNISKLLELNVSCERLQLKDASKSPSLE
ncbi:hypothetical protein BLNAU_22461 [Blattamonas nauphoetae]|uniref:Uncharacterized protein n=1 Tax=Blattamonas nauphoetae TaxID=2049346 RepID=A0ABQ9WX59_9EUKA|nr:hypothetical protein BLNAU_22461 [Blattamonas nauphoetae]